MFKKSPLNILAKNMLIMFNEESVSLGNSNNTATLFRKHKFTVIRPNYLNVSLTGDEINDSIDRKKSKAKRLTALLSKPFSGNKNVKDASIYLSLKDVPSYVLINPSQWDVLIKKDKDGSEKPYKGNIDTLIPLTNYIEYEEGISIGVKFSIKATNV